MPGKMLRKGVYVSVSDYSTLKMSTVEEQGPYSIERWTYITRATKTRPASKEQHFYIMKGHRRTSGEFKTLAEARRRLKALTAPTTPTPRKHKRRMYTR